MAKLPALLKCPYYVSMTDKFLSGWGKAQGKRARYIYCARDLEQARIIQQNAKCRGDQKNVTVAARPKFKHGDLVMFKTALDGRRWYEKEAFCDKEGNGKKKRRR